MVVSLRLLRGELAALRHEYIHLLKNVPLTQKLGFPDVIMPGDVRYFLYTLITFGGFLRLNHKIAFRFFFLQERFVLCN